MTIPSLQKPIQVLLFFTLLFTAAFFARNFLVPLVLAGLLAMLFQPLCARLETKGWNRVLAIVLCIACILLIVSGVLFLLSWQIADLASEAITIERNLNTKLSQVRQYIDNQFGISRQQQKEILNNGESSGRLPQLISGLIAGAGGFLTDTVLMFVYLFLLLYLRGHLRQFIIMLVPEAARPQAVQAIRECRKVAQHYLAGLSLMIACLWVLYGIGFSLLGVKNALFFAILCGLLEIIPFIGNLTGTLFTVITVFAQGGSSGMVVGVLITYALVQSVQTYLLEPLIVGAEVRINPFATIAGLVVGELVWGIPGMVLAIPLLGITKIICDHVNGWQPVGFLLGKTDKRHDKQHQQQTGT